jgi:4'-phosphopantetheinyl transferase EntD
MIKSPFPKYVGFAVKKMDNIGEYTLSDEEADILSPRAVKKRRDEFLLGRAACHSSLKQVGITSPPPVLKGSFREPIWPKGYIGSITHSSDMAICAVCPESRANGIGVDIESLEKDVSQGVFRMICNEEEIKEIRLYREGSQVMFKRFFSAKEAGFKAFFPHAREYIDYKEAVLSWDAEQECFHGILLKSAGDKYPAGSGFRVDSEIVDGFVFSHIMLPKES